MTSPPDWLMLLLQGLTVIILSAGVAVPIVLFSRKKANDRLDKIEENLQNLNKEVSYIRGQLDEQRNQTYKGLIDSIDKSISQQSS